MQGSTRIRDFVIGLVFLGSLAVLGVATLKVTNLPLLATPKYVQVPFSNVGGVRVGDDVRMHGFNVGLVTDIVPDFENRKSKVQLTCRIDHRIRLPEDSRFKVRSAGPLGGRYLEIVPGESPKAIPIEEGSGFFQGDAEGDLFDQLTGLLNRMDQDLTGTVAEAREMLHSINEAEGILGSLIKKEDLRDKAEQAIADIADTAQAIREQRGILGMLVNDSETRDRVRGTIENLEDISLAIRENRGTIGKLINEGEIYDDLSELVSSARNIVTEAENGKGALSMFLKDEEFKESLKSGVQSFEDTMAKVSSGEGTVGELIQNREVYESLNRILVQTEDAIEDLREQAPINTFVSAIFAAF